MTDVPVLLALTAGMVAALNPCGFAMLPAYLTMIVADTQGEGGSGRTNAVGRALGMTGAMTAGFVAVFGAFGLLVVPLALSLERFLPWATIVIGIALVGLGIALLAGRELLLATPKLHGAAPSRSFASMVLYGVAYAVASLSCTIGPFLAVTSTTFRSGTLLDGVAVFVLYALGMGLVVGILAVAVALARTGLVTSFRRAMPYIGRFSGALLVLAGAYVAYYGWYEVQLFNGGEVEDPIISTATGIQGAVTRFVTGIDPWAAAAVLLGLVTIGTAGVLLRRRRSDPHVSAPDTATQTPGAQSRTMAE